MFLYRFFCCSGCVRGHQGAQPPDIETFHGVFLAGQRARAEKLPGICFRAGRPRTYRAGASAAQRRCDRAPGVDINTLDSYENVILGSSVYGGNTFYKDFLIKNWETLKWKRGFVFAVGMLDKDHTNSKSEYESIPEDIRGNIQYVKLPGRIVFTKLNLFEKFIIKMIESKEKLSVDEMVDLQKANSVIFYFNKKK